MNKNNKPVDHTPSAMQAVAEGMTRWLLMLVVGLGAIRDHPHRHSALLGPDYGLRDLIICDGVHGNVEGVLAAINESDYHIGCAPIGAKVR